jgi:hypothetical protein
MRQDPGRYKYKTDKPVVKNAIKPKNGLRPKNRGKQTKTEAEGLLLNRQKAGTCGLA